MPLLSPPPPPFIIHRIEILFTHSFRFNTNIFISWIYSSSFINIFLPKKIYISCFVLLIERRRFVKYYFNCMSIWKEFFFHISFTPSFFWKKNKKIQIHDKKLKKAKAMWGEHDWREWNREILKITRITSKINTSFYGFIVMMIFVCERERKFFEFYFLLSLCINSIKWWLRWE